MTLSEMPPVTIIIPVFNDYVRLATCLQAIGSQTYKGHIKVVIADNNSEKIPDGIELLCKNIQIIVESKPGSYAARNKALELADTPIIAFTDSDCVPSATWLAEAVSLLNSANADLIAGRIDIFFARKSVSPSWTEWYESVLAFPQRENAAKGQSVTANLIIRSNVLNINPRFDENTLSGADYAFSKKATENGCKMVFGGNVVVGHPARESLAQIKKKIRRVVEGFYTLRHSDSSMCNEFTLKRFLSELAPPFNAIKLIKFEKSQKGLTLWTCVKVALLAWYIKVYRVYLKFRLITGLGIRSER